MMWCGQQFDVARVVSKTTVFQTYWERDRSQRCRLVQATAPSSERNSAIERAGMPGKRSRAIRARSAVIPRSGVQQSLKEGFSGLFRGRADPLVTSRSQRGKLS